MNRHRNIADDLAGVGISYLLVTANSLCHLVGIPFHLMSSGWIDWDWYLILMSYGNVIMSSRSDTLPFWSHPDEIANLYFTQHAVVLRRLRTAPPWVNRAPKCWSKRALDSTKTAILKANNRGFRFILVSNLVCYSAYSWKHISVNIIWRKLLSCISFKFSN